MLLSWCLGANLSQVPIYGDTVAVVSSPTDYMIGV